MLYVCVGGVDVGGGDGAHLMGSGDGVGGMQGSAHSEVVVGLGGGDGDGGMQGSAHSEVVGLGVCGDGFHIKGEGVREIDVWGDEGRVLVVVGEDRVVFVVVEGVVVEVVFVVVGGKEEVGVEVVDGVVMVVVGVVVVVGGGGVSKKEVVGER